MLPNYLFTAVSTTTTACNLGNINTNNWIFINAMVLVAMFAIGGLIYALVNILPIKQSNGIKKTVILGLSEGIISLIIFLILIFIVYAYRYWKYYKKCY